MKSRLLCGVAITAVATALGANTPAQAQTPSFKSWTGFYIGLNAGGAWGRSRADTNVECPAPATAYFCDSTGTGAANASAVTTSGTGTMNASGFTGGIQAGYNWQRNNLVYGLEADFGAFQLNGSRQGSGNYPVGVLAIAAADVYTVNSSFSTDWLATFRGRVGWTVMPDLLAYATGGLALTRLTVSNSFSDTSFAPPGAVENASESKVKTGWTLGGGLEWALNNDWAVKGEYLYLNFGKVTATGTITNDGNAPGYAQALSTSADLTAHVARLGVNRKF